MKIIFRFLCSAILAVATLQANAQTTDSTINLPNFLLPAFTKSIVLFKTGTTKTAMLNYNIVDEEMVFMQPDGYMVLDNPEVIDTILMDNRRFVPFKKIFYEVLLTNRTSLFMQHKSNAEASGTPTGYGATTKTQGNTYVRQMYGPIGSVDLRLPEDYKIVENNFYWVKTDSTMEKFTNKRQFLKIYKNKEKELNQFTDRNNIDFKRPDDIIRLINYYNELQK